MEVAAEHAEREGARAGEQVEERLLLDGIDCDARRVAPRHHERVPTATAHQAHAASAVDQLATVRARHAYKLAGTVRDRQLAPGQGKPVEGRIHFTNVRQ